MQMPNLSTDEARREYSERTRKATDEILASLRAAREQRNGRPAVNRFKWKHVNSNPNGGGM